MLLDIKRGAKSKKTRGQSLVEFALILPILLLLVLGALDIGRIITTKIAVTNAAREGANYLSRNAFVDDEANADDIDATCAVISREATSTDGTFVNVTIDCSEIEINLGTPPDCCTQGQPVQVTVRKTVELIYGDILELLGSISGPLEIASTVQMRVK